MLTDTYYVCLLISLAPNGGKHYRLGTAEYEEIFNCRDNGCLRKECQEYRISAEKHCKHGKVNDIAIVKAFGESRVFEDRSTAAVAGDRLLAQYRKDSASKEKTYNSFGTSYRHWWDGAVMDFSRIGYRYPCPSLVKAG